MDMFLLFVKVFAVGGGLCAIAQVLIDLTKLTPARILVLYGCVGVLLTADGLYEPLVRFADCGATTPLTGFGYLLAKGVEKAVSQTGLAGVFTGGLSGCAGGITAAMTFGYLTALFFSGKSK